MCVAAVAGSFLDSTSALAGPEVRDHRDPAPAPAPEVRDHRGGSVETTTRYRRRPGPRFMMPLKVDIGAVGAHTVTGLGSGIGGAIGIHWASLSPNPTDTDVGIGVFGALIGAPKDASGMGSGTLVGYGGTYLELGHTLASGSFWRTWAAGRGEYLSSSAFGETKQGFGGAGRLSAEFFVSGIGLEPRGVFLGTYAIGVYIEAGVRDVVPALGAVHVSGGLTFRTPLVFAP